MFKAYEMMETAVKHNAQGGEGSPKFRHLFSAEEQGNRAELMAVITLEPGESVGVHPHTSNGEAYFILEGGATMTEDGETRGVLSSRIFMDISDLPELRDTLDEVIKKAMAAKDGAANGR